MPSTSDLAIDGIEELGAWVFEGSLGSRSRLEAHAVGLPLVSKSVNWMTVNRAANTRPCQRCGICALPTIDEPPPRLLEPGGTQSGTKCGGAV